MGHTDMLTTLTKYARFMPRVEKQRATFLNNVDLKLYKNCTQVKKLWRKVRNLGNKRWWVLRDSNSRPHRYERMRHSFLKIQNSAIQYLS